MSNGIELQGIDGFIDLIDDMEITKEDTEKAIRVSLKKIKRYIEPKAPEKFGITKKSIKTKMRKGDFGAEGIVYIGSWAAMFQEYRNTKQKGKYVGWFERAIREGSDEFTDTLRKELFK